MSPYFFTAIAYGFHTSRVCYNWATPKKKVLSQQQRFFLSCPKAIFYKCFDFSKDLSCLPRGVTVKYWSLEQSDSQPR